MFKNKKLLVRIIALACAVVTIAAAFAVGNVLNVSAAEFHEEGPELTLASIQGDAESNKFQDAYDHTSTLTQGDGKYTIDTNSFVAWFPQDDVAFAYKYYGVSAAGDDYIEATVTADYFTNPDGSAFDLTKEAHNPSTGLMFRSSLENDAAFIFLHVRNGGDIYLCYRDPSFEYLYSCTHQVGKSVTSKDYPLQFKMKLKAGLVQIEYKGVNDAAWSKFTPVKIPAFRNGIYAGLCAHSGAQAQTLRATFTDLKMEGIASLGEPEGGGGEVKPTEEPVLPDEELPNPENVMLRETFTDGSFNNGNEAVNNPIWTRFPEAFLKIQNLQGNRVLYAEYGDDWDVAGETSWTDYSASLEMQFHDSNVEEDFSAIGLIVRHVTNIFYGYENYIVTVQNGHKICVYENFLQTRVDLNAANIMAEFDLREIYGDAEFTLIGDGLTHILKVDCLDNTLTIYFDGEKIGTYTDNHDRTNSGNGSDIYAVNSMGQVGIIFKNVFGWADNLVVRDIEDPLGGDYDNKICGNWDKPIPDYIAERGEK